MQGSAGAPASLANPLADSRARWLGWRMLLAPLAALSVLASQAVPLATGGPGAPVLENGIAGRVWRSARLSPAPNLVVVLHGDLAGPRDDYQYQFAATAASRLEDTIVVAALRPGYADHYRTRSSGVHGLATGDNYTPEVVQQVSGFIRAEKAAYNAKSITVVGHSGGAAIAADVVENEPNIATRLLLVSCPCDVRRWRLHMALRQLNPAWLLPVRSQSPLDRVGRLPSGLRLQIVVGQDDAVAPPYLSLAFARAARRLRIRAGVLIVQGAGHEIFLEPPVIGALVSLQSAP